MKTLVKYMRRFSIKINVVFFFLKSGSTKFKTRRSIRKILETPDPSKFFLGPMTFKLSIVTRIFFTFALKRKIQNNKSKTEESPSI